MAKRMIFLVIILTIFTHIHEPLHRQLINDLDGDQQRIWCLSQYSPTITKYNTFITLFQPVIPFSIYFVSASALIIVAACSRFKIESKQTFKEHFQFLLGLSRLIISFSTGCMRSARQPWLYLIGYFLFLLPSMLALFVFVLPSEVYKSELDKTIQ
ncbi:unnamed protein product [Rotaria magnacalcarata]|uniref:Uncharacterized protein n=1 Tax=Rotaria magnacalcarata TaxID=392030 RepID=A0A815YBS6_9BILA|nr:unnamed protein product [Rotaria magnacalcarata]CAF3859621.1 unnamed protein product [Rotaria magnacalcarata]